MHMFLRFSSLWHHSSWLRCCHVVRNQRQTNKVELPWLRQSWQQFCCWTAVAEVVVLLLLLVYCLVLLILILVLLILALSLLFLCLLSFLFLLFLLFLPLFLFVLVLVFLFLVNVPFDSAVFLNYNIILKNPKEDEIGKSKINNRITTNSSMSVCTKATKAKPAAKVRKHRSQKKYTNRPQLEIGPSIFFLVFATTPWGNSADLGHLLGDSLTEAVCLQI